MPAARQRCQCTDGSAESTGRQKLTPPCEQSRTRGRSRLSTTVCCNGAHLHPAAAVQSQLHQAVLSRLDCTYSLHDESVGCQLTTPVGDIHIHSSLAVRTPCSSGAACAAGSRLPRVYKHAALVAARDAQAAVQVQPVHVARLRLLDRQRQPAPRHGARASPPARPREPGLAARWAAGGWSRRSARPHGRARSGLAARRARRAAGCSSRGDCTQRGQH